MSNSISPEAEATRITGEAAANSKLLRPEQRAAYERDGFVSIQGLVDRDWLDRLRGVTADFVEQSRKLASSTPLFDLEPDHTPEHPRLRRLEYLDLEEETS